MRLVAVALNRPPGSGGTAAEAPDRLVEALLGSEAGARGLEHARLQPSRAGAVGVLFLSSRIPGGAPAALAQAREICERACHSTPPLRGWSVDWCREVHPVLDPCAAGPAAPPQP
ncbi:hypothetical protein WDV06_18615 [Streptomyces racemochromogenes]|uniref:Uncharacterized protein n=1 Tax=Streptomyces racemochromogenes TaxID=67353 RepID=A0ABW7PFD4_9ACTN